MKTGRSLFNIILLITMLVMVFMSLEYNPKARLFPLSVGIITFVMLLWQFVIDQFPRIKEKLYRNSSSSSEEKEEKNEESQKPWMVALQCLIALIVLTVLLNYISYLIAVPIFLLLFVWLIGKAKFIRALSVTVVVSVFVYVLFDLVLQSSI